VVVGEYLKGGLKMKGESVVNRWRMVKMKGERVVNRLENGKKKES
jgi:hypothetical protein